MARRGKPVPCPVCDRPTSVGREEQRVFPHSAPESTERCDGSGTWVDLYGTGRREIRVEVSTEPDPPTCGAQRAARSPLRCELPPDHVVGRDHEPVEESYHYGRGPSGRWYSWPREGS